MREHQGETVADRRGAPSDPLAVEAPHRPGVDAVKRLFAAGEPKPEEVAQVMIAYPAEYDDILRYLHGVKGNQYAFDVEKVIHAMLPPTPTDELLTWEPAAEQGDDGEAAWLLRAVTLGWVGARGETRRHLDAYVKRKKSVESVEGIPHPSKDRGVKPKRTIGEGEDKVGVYDVSLGDAPILATLVHMVRTHINKRLADRHPYPTEVFDLGTMLRRDHGFGGSRHTTGNAIDLGGMEFSTVDDVLYALDLLPEGKVARVFPDNREHMHLAIDGDRFELGLPFQGDFFPSNLNIIHTRKAAIAKAGDETTATARGLAFGDTHMTSSKGTYDAAKQEWSWTEPAASGKLAIEYLKSEPLKQKLTELGAPRS